MSQPRRQRYFAYGSNLSVAQMAERCPAATPGESVQLPGWRFIINRDGVATLLPRPGGLAAGLIWHLTAACEAALDRFEGVATDEYRRVEMPIGGAAALVYLATEQRPGFPLPGYLERVVGGAADVGLDPAYVAQLGRWAGAVTPALLHRVLAGYPLARSGIHGPAHWLRVLENGRRLAALTPGADPGLVELFALLHDSQRLDDGADPGHGERAALFARHLAAEGHLVLPSAQLELLCLACARHEWGEVSADPTIGCCWDADRLELSRLGRRPRAKLLSTAAALEPAVQASAWERGIERVVLGELAARWGFAG